MTEDEANELKSKIKDTTTICERCGDSSWLWLAEKHGQIERVRCAGCGFERDRTEKDYAEFETALERAYINHKQAQARVN
jgi:ribosomal protein L37E